jgi:hypothetical protein
VARTSAMPWCLDAAASLNSWLSFRPCLDVIDVLVEVRAMPRHRQFWIDDAGEIHHGKPSAQPADPETAT